MSFLSYRIRITPALRQPRECPLHHPPPGFVSFGSVTRLVLLADPPDVWGTGIDRRLPTRRVVIPLVQTQVLRGVLDRGLGPLSPRWPRSSPAASCSRGRSRPRWPAPTAHPRLPPARTSSCPFSRDPSGFCPGHRIKIGGLGRMANSAFGGKLNLFGTCSHLFTMFMVYLVVDNKYNVYVR